jgi:hypothetical protein
LIIGHLPAGYIASRLLAVRLAADGVNERLFVATGMSGAIAPDLDMLYFYLVDQRQHHHHTYFTHVPIVWASMLLASVIFWMSAGRNKALAVLAVIFSLNGFIHLLLDSIVGDIWWLAPFVDRPFSLFTVPALYEPWWLNFVLHWSFGLELFLVAWAVLLWRRVLASAQA